jgi:prenylated cyclic peptide (anacyclamide/piricyclamide family)
MTKKNIRPQQVAPVERETTSTAKDQSGQVSGSWEGGAYGGRASGNAGRGRPFAGDDAE